MKRAFTVVHVRDLDQAKRNVYLSKSIGYDGAFLINHGIDGQTLLRVFHAIRQETNYWLGVRIRHV